MNFVTPPIQNLQPELYNNVQNDKAEPNFSSQSDNLESVVKDTYVETTKDEPGFDLIKEEMVKFKIWPQGAIPYYIDVYSYSDKVLRDRIRGFLNTVNSITSLNFLELPSPPTNLESRWVFFINRRGLLGCADHSTNNVTNIGVQKVILGYDCMSTGSELAEAVLAIAGVSPQHNSPDRNKYISVVEQNIMPDKKHLFRKLNNNEWLFHDIEYDFDSAGHYHPHKYSVNGQATIKMQEKYQDNLVGENKGFSSKDILKIKMLYNLISKKKQNITVCHKLFAPGSNFNSYQPDNVAISPRKKPNKYTGLSNDTIEDDVLDKIVTPQIEDKDGSKQKETYEDNVSTPVQEQVQEPIENLSESDYKTDARKPRLKLQPKTVNLVFGKPEYT